MQLHRLPHPSASRHAFSLVEAMVGMSILALAAAVLLLGAQASLHSTMDAEDETIASGLAEQLLDEILGRKYMASLSSSPQQYPLGHNSWEAAGNGRERFNDTDDFHNFQAQPAEDMWGIELGQGDGTGSLRHPDFRAPPGRFATWRQDVELYYVDENDPTVRLIAPEASNMRCVVVTISREQSDGTMKPLAVAKRVFTYVPPLP